MIVKKIPRLSDASGFGHAQHVRNLVDYMQLPDKGSAYAEALLRYLQEEGIEVEGVERLLHLNARNFLTESVEGQRAEMMASASRAVRSPNPLSHWLISWKEHERPSPQQLDEAVEMFLSHLGLGRHQAIYAAHSDTHNVHLHIAVNRYDPVRRRMLKVNGGFDLEAAHAAIALIVEKQGWEPEVKARYHVVEGSVELTPDAMAAKIEGRKSPGTAAASYEARTGLKSAQRIAIEEAAPAMLAARSWAELHYALAAKGIEYIPIRSGAVLKINNEHVTASSAHRRCSHGNLVSRLGDYKPRFRSVVVRDRKTDENVLEGAILADEFHNLRASAATKREQEQREIRSDRRQKLDEVEQNAAADRRKLARLEDGGRSPERSALSSIIAAKEKKARSAIVAEAKDDLKRVRSKHRVPADYEEWLRAQREDYLAERWRKRGQLDRWVGEFVGISSPAYPEPAFDDFSPRTARDCVLWGRKGEPTAFIEWPDRIEIAMPKDEAAILAGFLLAHRKYGKVTIKGPTDFQERAVAVITAHGLASHVANPEVSERFKNVERAEREQASADVRQQRDDPAPVASESKRTSHDQQDGTDERTLREFERRKARGR